MQAFFIRRGTGTPLGALSSRVIAGSEATLALPLGELSPKVTERAWQALTDSPKAFPCSGRVLRDCHALLRKARNDKLGGHCLFNIGPHFPPVQCREGHAAPLQCTNGNFPRSIFSFPLPSCSSSTHNVINIFVLWKKHKNPRGNPKRSLIIPSRRDLTNAGKCDKIKAQRESGAFKNTDPVFGIARQDRFVADRLGTPAFAAGAPFFFRRGREENQNV